MELIPANLLNVLTVALFYSIIQTALVEWIKQSKLFNSTFTFWFINCALCAVLGAGFAMYFYDMELISGLWVSLLSAIGASGIYKSFIKTKNELSGEVQPVIPPSTEVNKDEKSKSVTVLNKPATPIVVNKKLNTINK